MTEEPELPRSADWVNGAQPPEPPPPGLGARVWMFFLGLPRKVQLAIAAVLVAAVGRAAGVDDAVVRALFGEIAEVAPSSVEMPKVPPRRCGTPPDALDLERLDQEALDAASR